MNSWRITGLLFPDLLRLWSGSRRGERAAVLRKILSPTVVVQRYGSASTTLTRYGYYPRRLLALAWRYGPLFWRLLWRDQVLTAQAERKAQLAAWLHPFTIRPPVHPPPA